MLRRPLSVNLSSMDNQNDFLLRDNLCTSQNSLDQNQGLYTQGLFNNAAVNNEVGSSLSMDSGNPLGTQSLESLDDRSHNTPLNTSSGEACSDISRYLLKAFCCLRKSEGGMCRSITMTMVTGTEEFTAYILNLLPVAGSSSCQKHRTIYKTVFCFVCHSHL